MYVQTDSDGRITATSEANDLPGAFVYEFPDGFDFECQRDYVIRDGALVSDPSPETLEQEAAERMAAAQPTAEERTDALMELAAMVADQEAALVELAQMIGGSDG